MKTKWTPGPWMLEEYHQGFEVWPPAGQESRGKIAELALADESNARLISLAPEMAEALRDELEALRVWRIGNDLPQDVRAGIHISVDKIERLLARLEGGEK